jgi:hypothetical protein
MTVDGGQKVADADATIGDLLAASVCGADHLTAANAAAAEENRGGAGPMILARLPNVGRSTGRAFAAIGDLGILGIRLPFKLLSRPTVVRR